MIVAGLLFCVSTALAQFPLRVRVVDAESDRPLSGALMSAVDGPTSTAGTAATLVGGDGTATLRVPATGLYRILIRRIGYAPFTSDTVRVSGTSSVAITIKVPATRIALATVRVTASRACDGDAMNVSSEAAPLWEEVRKALEASVLSRGTSFIVTTGMSYRRMLANDGKLINEDTTAKGTAGARPFSAVDPALLARGGYVQGSYQSSLTFNAPDEQVLLSDGFSRRHCLSMVSATRRSGDTTLIGLAFEPRTDNQLSEIRGTVWVDSATSELRRLEYTYVRAPLPFPVNGLGGVVDFQRHRSGAWYVSGWTIRMPRWRPSTVGGGGVALAGYAEVGGVASALREVAALPASQVRMVTGNVFDSLSTRDMPGAVVKIPALGRETTTDFLGRYRFDSVAVGIWDVVANYPPLAGTGMVQMHGVADIVETQRADIPLAVPSFATLWKRECAGQPLPSGSGGFVMGQVRAPDGTPVSSAAVEFSWKEPPRDSTRRLQLVADSAGKYMMCVGNGSGVTVRVMVDSLSSVPVTFSFVPARVAKRDLVIATDEQAAAVRVDSTQIVEAVPVDVGGVVDGSVKDPSGRRISAARVRLLDLVGEARVTGTNGEFAYRGVPPGQHVVSIEAIGFERVRRVVNVGAGDSAHVEVRLGRLAALGAVNISERARVTAIRKDIDERVLAGNGYLTDSLKIEKLPFISRAFEAPGVRVRTVGTSWTVEVPRATFSKGFQGVRWCTAQVFIDDAPSDFDKLNGMNKQNLALVELYSRAANAPLKYTGSGTMSNSGSNDGTCGVVLVWTKQFLRAADMMGKPLKKP